MKTFTVRYKADGLPARDIKADKMKVDGNSILFICDSDPKDKRVVAIVNVDAIREAYEAE